MFTSHTLQRMATTLDSVGRAWCEERPAVTPSFPPPRERDDGRPDWAATAAIRSLDLTLDEAMVVITRTCAEAAEALRLAARAYDANAPRSPARFT